MGTRAPYNTAPSANRQTLFLRLSHPANVIYLPGYTGHPGYHLSQTVQEFLARIGGRTTIQTCVPDIDAQNLIAVLLHCDKGFRDPNNLPTGGVDMAPLNKVPHFWWRFFGKQWSETGKMFAVRLAPNMNRYPQRSSSVRQ
ncbi:hypothetical protein FN846DRAFT_905056 [Sphaerosporella brunnea]|uniref:Uncharacterized protein n=1 Tax=Sphaerosporella brunnea TaxID=1250544 RepID=A0A5J5F2L2_9PEZI|nr:hypothetical protein FN846DRAFT_905056 [Sphaerosporella brunnea]